jgi:hypothetical protein
MAGCRDLCTCWVVVPSGQYASFLLAILVGLFVIVCAAGNPTLLHHLLHPLVVIPPATGVISLGLGLGKYTCLCVPVLAFGVCKSPATVA